MKFKVESRTYAGGGKVYTSMVGEAETFEEAKAMATKHAYASCSDYLSYAVVKDGETLYNEYSKGD